MALGGRFIESLIQWSDKESNARRNRLFLLSVTAFVLTLLLIPSQHFVFTSFKSGDIATSDIRATRDYLLEDQSLTETKRIEAEGSAPLVYEYLPDAQLDVTRRFTRVFELLRGSRVHDADGGTSFREAVENILGFPLSPEELSALSRVRGEKPLLAEISHLANRFYAKKTVADRSAFESDRLHGIVLVSADTNQELPVGDGFAYTEAAKVRNDFGQLRTPPGISPADAVLINGLIVKSLKPNVAFNSELTDKKRREARESVRPVLFQVKRGEMIVRVGERVSAEQALKLGRIADARRGSKRFLSLAGTFALVMILFYFPYRFARKNIRKFNPANKDILLLSVVTLSSFIVLKLALVVSTAMGGTFPYIDTRDYFYLFPFAAAPMIVRIILNSEVALVYCAICAPLFGIMFDNSLTVVLFAMLSGVVGAHGVRHCKDRGTIYMAGLKLCVVNLAMALAFQLLNESFFSFQTLYCGLFAIVGGLVNAAVVMGTIPVLETIFHYTTDIKLLELSNLNSPVLKELMIRAPGTYHHSVLVGTMVEAAAETINANPLLARVAAYYHDIGKLSKPLYFIENAGPLENRHDKLSPNMSALILISHVKEGVELAKEHRLGLPIIDIIRQSHGTALITYFYQKAKNMADPEVQSINERDYRYPGPKPQTREAGLVMLADCVEAASRTLTDPTSARIQGMVQKIINNIFIDGQLDECELTLKNLHEIAKSFNRILCGIYHQRIDYPEPVFKEKTGGRKNVEDSDKEQSKTVSDRGEETKKSGGEDIRRLGIS